MKVDLHGKTWAEALEEFVDSYNRAVASGGVLRVVHGYGSTGAGGVLRARFRGFVERQAERLEFTPGEKADGNPGHTLVTPRLPLPDADAVMCELVWEYCEQPKTMNKIAGQFRRYGAPLVQQAVRSLENQQRLRKSVKGRNSVYQAV